MPLQPFGLEAPGTDELANAWLVLSYLWLPYMILPIQASLERLPPSLLQASADLGARPRQTFMQVILPLSIPGIAAGSIFTFSLTLGDFIVPQLVGPPGYFVGSMVYAQQGAIGNMPISFEVFADVVGFRLAVPTAQIRDDTLEALTEGVLLPEA